MEQRGKKYSKVRRQVVEGELQARTSAGVKQSGRGAQAKVSVEQLVALAVEEAVKQKTQPFPVRKLWLSHSEDLAAPFCCTHHPF